MFFGFGQLTRDSELTCLITGVVKNKQIKIYVTEFCSRRLDQGKMVEFCWSFENLNLSNKEILKDARMISRTASQGHPKSVENFDLDLVATENLN